MPYTLTASCNIASGPGPGQTVYLRPNGHTTNESGGSGNPDRFVPVLSHACTFSKMRARASDAPGTSQSFTFTLRKNGVDQTLTCAISGLNTNANDLVNSVTFAEGDDWSVKEVLSAGAGGGAVCMVSFEVTPS